jgi:hypothetical protein
MQLNYCLLFFRCRSKKASPTMTIDINRKADAASQSPFPELSTATQRSKPPKNELKIGKIIRISTQVSDQRRGETRHGGGDGELDAEPHETASRGALV